MRNFHEEHEQRKAGEVLWLAVIDRAVPDELERRPLLDLMRAYSTLSTQVYNLQFQLAAIARHIPEDQAMRYSPLVENYLRPYRPSL